MSSYGTDSFLRGEAAVLKSSSKKSFVKKKDRKAFQSVCQDAHMV